VPTQRLAAVSLWPDPSALRAELQNELPPLSELLEPLSDEDELLDELLPLSELLEPLS
jgi:hypothetical protein